VLDNLASDVRFGLRSLWKNRGVTVLAVLCLAIGVGLNATMFSVVDGVLIQGLPYKDPERIIFLTSMNQKAGRMRAGMSYADFRDVRDNAQVFESIGAVQFRSLTISDTGHEPERYSSAAVSWNLFDLLGTQPIAGRAFRASDDVPNAEPVVMLSHTV